MERNNAYLYLNSIDLTKDVVRRLDVVLPSIKIDVAKPMKCFLMLQDLIKDCHAY